MNVIVYKAVLAAVAYATTHGARTVDEPMKVQDILSGHDTQIETAAMELITDDSGWQRLWQRHKGPVDAVGSGAGVAVQSAEPAPQIDFKKSFVLALFAGQTSNVASYELVEMEPQKGDSEIVRLRPILLPSANGVVTNPYAIVLVSHTKKPILVQVPSGQDKWQTVARFVPPKKKS